MKDDKFLFLIVALFAFMIVGFLLMNKKADNLQERLDYYENVFDKAYWKTIQLHDESTGQVKYWNVMVKGPVAPPEPSVKDYTPDEAQ